MHLDQDKLEVISLLKNETEQTFDRRILTASDCVQLSEDIYFKTSLRINPNTLRRLFGLVKSQFQPSASTLNILANYCGFASITDLVAVKNRNTYDSSELNSSILNYLISLFRSTRVKDDNDETFHALVKHTVRYIQHYPAMADKFQRAIARTKNGQDYYFEQFVNTDKINSFYGDGLRYYMAEKKTDAAQIFGNSLLCFRSWLINDAEGITKNYKNLSGYSVKAASHPLFIGMCYAATVLYRDMIGLEMESLLEKIHQVYNELEIPQDKYQAFPCFELYVGRALVYARQFSEADYFIQNALDRYFKKENKSNDNVRQELLLYQAISAVGLGRKVDAIKILSFIKPTQFSFLNKKTNTILYLLANQYLQKGKFKGQQQLQASISETGFTRLNSILH